MIAHCFRQIKECACRVEKNRFDHFNANVRRATSVRNVMRRLTLSVNNLTPESTPPFFCLAKSAQYALHGSRAMNAIDESLPLRNWTQSAGEELANGISHGIGLVGAIIATPILLLAAFHHGDVPFLIGAIIFTATMLFVYLASTLYHGWPPE